MSGITTTGSTIISNLDEAPKSILLLRAMLQWLGGIGIIVMAITLMPIMNVGGMQLFKISSNDSSEKILPKSKEISLRLIYVYLSLTFLCAFTYSIFGMSTLKKNKIKSLIASHSVYEFGIPLRIAISKKMVFGFNTKAIKRVGGKIS